MFDFLYYACPDHPFEVAVHGGLIEGRHDGLSVIQYLRQGQWLILPL